MDYYNLNILIADDHPIIRRGITLSVRKKFPKATLHECESPDEIIENLIKHNISNAIRFTHSGIINVESICINSNIHLIISDTGRGIKPEIKNQLNRKNFKIQHKNDIKHRSYGFGYNLIFKLLPQLQADIQIENNLPQGTTVTLKLPITIQKTN